MSLPTALEEVVRDFADTPADLRLEVLLEYSERVPTLPPDLVGDRGAMEQVHECQTPFFLSAEVHADRTVDVWFDCPPEAPTTRGFAGILSEGLRGATVEEVEAVPDDFYLRLGLGDVVSPLRLRGMTAILGRLKRRVREAQATAG